MELEGWTYAPKNCRARKFGKYPKGSRELAKREKGTNPGSGDKRKKEVVPDHWLKLSDQDGLLQHSWFGVRTRKDDIAGTVAATKRRSQHDET